VYIKKKRGKEEKEEEETEKEERRKQDGESSWAREQFPLLPPSTSPSPSATKMIKYDTMQYLR